MSLEKNKESRENYKLMGEDLTTYDNLLEFKKHINYLAQLFDNNFKGFKYEKIEKTNDEIYNDFITINNISKHSINLFINLKKMKPKLFKISRT